MKTIFAESFEEQPLWWQDAAPVGISDVERSGETDVLIVGSGYAGLSCALSLSNSGMDVTVVDAEKCGMGASTRNAGFLSGRAGVSKQIDLQAAVGEKHAAEILNEADEAYESLKTLVEGEHIHCHLEQVGRFVGAHTPKAFEKLSLKVDEYNCDGLNRYRMISRQEQREYANSDYWYGGMLTQNAGLIHPSLYHQGLRTLCQNNGVKIVSDSRVVGIVNDGGKKIVETITGTFKATEVVLATNGYTDNLSPWHQKRLIPISSTLVASEELGSDRVNALLPTGCPVIDTRRVLCFARPSPDGKRILFGGRARFTSMTGKQSAEILHGQLTEMFPQLSDIQVTNVWSGRMAFTFDFLPKIGVHEGIHYALGCNAGCGIVMMSWLGKKVAEKILCNQQPTSAFERLPFKSPTFYAGKPWFLPIVGNWWRLRDWAERAQIKST